MINFEKFDLDSYKKYITHANKDQKIIRSVNDRIIRNRQWIDKLEDKDSTFNYLDIGCGDGRLTVPILKKLSSLKKNGEKSINAYCVDSNPVVLETLSKKITSDEKFDKVNIKYVNECIENVVSKTNNIKKLDLVLCSHTLYYIDNWHYLINSLLNKINSEGMMCFTIASKNCEVYKLRDQLLPNLQIPSAVELRFAEDLERIIAQENLNAEIEYEDSDVIFSEDEIKQFINSTSDENKSVTEVLAFLFGYFGKDIRRYGISKIKNYARERIKDKTGELSLGYRDGIFWIKK